MMSLFDSMMGLKTDYKLSYEAAIAVEYYV